MFDSLYHRDLSYGERLEFGDIQLAQIGKLYGTGRLVVDSHTHPSNLFEITVVTNGAGTISTNGIPLPVTAGDTYLSLPCEVHKIVSNPDDPIRFCYMAFSFKEGEWRRTFDALAQAQRSEVSRIFRNDHLATVLGTIIAELSEQKLHSHEVITACLCQVLSYIDRGFCDATAPEHREDVSHADFLCMRLMTYIDNHIDSLKTLDELAEKMGYSYGYLSSLFRKTTSFTLSSYYSRKRMDTAHRLLIKNNLSPTEIAHILNYSSVYAFSKAFHKTFGLSPREYRRREKDSVKTKDTI